MNQWIKIRELQKFDQDNWISLVETILKFRNIKNAPFLKGLHSDAQLKYVLHSDTH